MPPQAFRAACCGIVFGFVQGRVPEMTPRVSTPARHTLKPCKVVLLRSRTDDYRAAASTAPNFHRFWRCATSCTGVAMRLHPHLRSGALKGLAWLPHRGGRTCECLLVPMLRRCRYYREKRALHDGAHLLDSPEEPFSETSTLRVVSRNGSITMSRPYMLSAVCKSARAWQQPTR